MKFALALAHDRIPDCRLGALLSRVSAPLIRISRNKRNAVPKSLPEEFSPGRGVTRFPSRVNGGTLHCFREAVSKPKIYKIGPTWILWVPGVRVYRFTTWSRALSYALDPQALLR
jgi:hypothetical protein